MALKGLDIFKLSPKKNCKECGCPTCMAFSMKVAQGAVDIAACPYFAPEALAKLSAATEPPMKTIKVGAGDAEQSLGGETVLFRHEKTFVSRTRYAMSLLRLLRLHRSPDSCFQDLPVVLLYRGFQTDLLRLHQVQHLLL